MFLFFIKEVYRFAVKCILLPRLLTKWKTYLQVFIP